MNVPRVVISANTTLPANQTVKSQSCHPAQTTEAIVLFTIGALGMGANLFLMLLIILKRPLRRWSQGLLFHQGLVDCGRASLLVPLGVSILLCQKLPKCSYIEMAFLLLVTVSTVNMLTSVINDASLLPDQDPSALPPGTLRPGSISDANPLFLDSPQCIGFGLFIIWFASLTINLGPTLLGGALASTRELGHLDACPMVYAPVRNYVLSVLWVTVNVLCVALTGIHLRKLYRDLTRSNLEAVRIAGIVTTMISIRSDVDNCESQHIQGYIHRLEQEGVRRVKSFAIILAAYIIFWGPLFTLTLIHPKVDASSITYEVTLHVAFVHAFVNPTLLLVLHRDLRNTSGEFPCCHTWIPEDYGTPPNETGQVCRMNRGYMETTI